MHVCVHVLSSFPPLHACMHSSQNKTKQQPELWGLNVYYFTRSSAHSAAEKSKAWRSHRTHSRTCGKQGAELDWLSVVKMRWLTNPACYQFPNPGVSCPSEKLAEGLAPEPAVISSCFFGLCGLRFLCSGVSHRCWESIVTFSRRRGKAWEKSLCLCPRAQPRH